MNSVLTDLREKYSLDINSPFRLNVEGQIIKFDYLVKNYGARNGMVVDSDWNKIKLVADLLVEMGYGYSCLEIDASSVDGFDEVLNDWGKNNA